MADDHDNRPRRRRIVLCMGATCNMSDRAEPFYDCLHAAFGDPGPAFMAHGPVSWEVANCLDMCDDGPNLTLYPGGHDVHGLTVERLQEIIEQIKAELAHES
jgi:NADH:ubiquinone oxidoreductase subunit E